MSTNHIDTPLNNEFIALIEQALIAHFLRCSQEGHQALPKKDLLNDLVHSNQTMLTLAHQDQKRFLETAQIVVVDLERRGFLQREERSLILSPHDVISALASPHPIFEEEDEDEEEEEELEDAEEEATDEEITAGEENREVRAAKSQLKVALLSTLGELEESLTPGDLRTKLKRTLAPQTLTLLIEASPSKKNSTKSNNSILLDVTKRALKELLKEGLSVKEGQRWTLSDLGKAHLQNMFPDQEPSHAELPHAEVTSAPRSTPEITLAEEPTPHDEEKVSDAMLSAPEPVVESVVESVAPLTVISKGRGTSSLEALINEGGAEGYSFEEPKERKQPIFKMTNLSVNHPLTFTGCHFDYLHLDNGHYQEITFIDCVFKGPLTLNGCTLNGALSFQGTKLSTLEVSGSKNVRFKAGRETLLSCFLSLPSLSLDNTKVDGHVNLNTLFLPHLHCTRSVINAMNLSRVNHVGDDEPWSVLSELPLELKAPVCVFDEESELKNVDFSRTFFKELKLLNAHVNGLSQSDKKAPGNLFHELTVMGSELRDVHLKSESPICKLKVERSRLINSSFDLSKVCTTATTLEALGLQAPAHSELSLQDNLLCGVTLKLNPHVKILSSTRDILSSEEGVKEGRNLTIEGGALTRLKMSELSLDAGHLALDGVSAEESHFQIALAELKKEWSGVDFVKQLKSLKLETDSSSESAEEPERAPNKLEQLQLRLKERVTKTEGQNSLWGMKANQCHLNNVRELSLPVRNVRFTNTQLTGKATNSEPLKFTIPNEELSIKGCRLECLDLVGYQRDDKPLKCDKIQVERSQLFQCSIKSLESSLIKFSSCEFSRVHLDNLTFHRPIKEDERLLLGLILFMCKTKTSQESDSPLMIRSVEISQKQRGVLSLDRSVFEGVILTEITTPRLDLKSTKLTNAKLSHIETNDVRLWRTLKDKIIISPYLLNKESALFLEIESAHFNDIYTHLDSGERYSFQKLPQQYTLVKRGGAKPPPANCDLFLLESNKTFAEHLNALETEEDKGGTSSRLKEKEIEKRLRDEFSLIPTDDKLIEGFLNDPRAPLSDALIQHIFFQVRNLYEATEISDCDFNHCYLLPSTQPNDAYKEVYARIEHLEERGLQKIIKRPTFTNCNFKACQLSGPVLNGVTIKDNCVFSQGTQLFGEVLAHTHITHDIQFDDCVISGCGTFKRSSFAGKLLLQDCVMKQDAKESFDGADFLGEVSLNRLTLEEQLSLKGSSFKHDLILKVLVQPTSRELLIDLEGARFEKSLSFTLPRFKGALEQRDAQAPLPLKINLTQVEVKDKLDLSDLGQDPWEQQQRDEKSKQKLLIYLCLLLTRSDKIVTPMMSHELRSHISQHVQLERLPINQSPQGQLLAFYSAKLEGSLPSDATNRAKRKHQAKLAIEHYEWLTLFERAARERQAPYEVGYYVNQQRRLLTKAHSALFRWPHSVLYRLVQRYQLDIYRVNGEKSLFKFLFKLFFIAAFFFTLHRFVLSCKLPSDDLLLLVTLEAWLSPVLSLLDINIEGIEMMKQLSTHNQIVHAFQRLFSLLLLAPLVGLPHQLITHERIAQQVRHHLRKRSEKEPKADSTS